MPLSSIRELLGKRSLPPSMLDLLSKASYWPNVLAHADSSYSEHVAALMSLASLGAYEDNGGEVLKGLLVQRLDLDPARVDVANVDVTTPALFVDTNAYVVTISPGPEQPSAPHVIVVAFRGTEFVGKNFLVDVLTDARAVPVEFPLGSGHFVHGGFLAAADLVWSSLIEKLVSAPNGAHNGSQHQPINALTKALKSPSSRLYITGHSLGGAIAVLAAARLLRPPQRTHPGLSQLRQQFCGVYTFGQPMVGGEGFVSFADTALTAMTHRHVYQNDWVPHLPPWTTGTYRHFGLERRGSLGRPFDAVDEKTGQAVTASGSGLLAVLPFVFRAVQVLNRFAFPYSLEDHQPENYWRSCEARL
jgi:hypothetical protein